MKIQAITTLVTAAAVSFFPVKSPERPVDHSASDAMEQMSPATSGLGSFNWVVLNEEPGSGIQLLQASGADLLDDPLVGDGPDSGYNAGGVVKLAAAQPTDEIIEDFDSLDGMVIDVVSPTRVSPVNDVNEVTVAVSEPASPVVEASIAPDKTELASNLEGAELSLDQIRPVADADDSVTAEAKTVSVPRLNLASGPPVEEEKQVGLADRLVSQVSKAVGMEDEKSGDNTSGEEAAPTMGEDDGGFWLRAAKLNDVFQYLARLGHRQYFHNADLEAANYVVTGHLGDGDPLEQMEELSLMYAITIHQKGNTVYAMTPAQLAQLPTKPFYYQLKYLRPSDIEQIKSILQPMLTPGSGTVDFEQKTSTLIFIDNEQRIENIRGILQELDRPKQQIAIETRILRIKSSSRNRIGVDWESVLGDGMTVSATEALNALFNLPDSDLVEQVISSSVGETSTGGYSITNRGTALQETILGDITGTTESTFSDASTRTINSNESHLVLSPLQLQATLRALNTGGLAQQESSPTLITEDNEAGIISIIDRIPIITATISQTDAGQNVTEEVRYRVDQDDPSSSDDPAASREIGVTVAVTPTILPDNTVRMALRPRSAQIVEFIEGRTGNLYPRVNESTVDTIARVPNGFSLLIGGFYEEQESEDVKKVPFLGDIPGVNFFFKSSDKIKEHTSLVFVVTPKLYEPVKIPEVDRINRELHQNHVLPNDHAWPDRQNPGSNYEPNLGWTVGNVVNAYPQTPPSNPLNPEHPVNLPEWDVRDQPAIRSGQTMVEPAEAQSERKGLLGNLFKKRQR